jgi:alpha-tubulin suppressor-like RCC1 family protein
MLTDNFMVYVLGRNIFGQLGLAHNDNIAEPTHLASLHSVDAIACGAEHSVAVSGGKIYAWGLNCKG